MQDVYRSADGGQTWVANGVNSTKLPTNPDGRMPNMNICHAQCWYNQMVLVDPRDAARNTVWIGGNLAIGAHHGRRRQLDAQDLVALQPVPGAALRARRPPCRGLQDDGHADASSWATTAA